MLPDALPGDYQLQEVQVQRGSYGIYPDTSKTNQVLQSLKREVIAGRTERQDLCC